MRKVENLESFYKWIIETIYNFVRHSGRGDHVLKYQWPKICTVLLGDAALVDKLYLDLLSWFRSFQSLVESVRIWSSFLMQLFRLSPKPGNSKNCTVSVKQRLCSAECFLRIPLVWISPISCGEFAAEGIDQKILRNLDLYSFCLMVSCAVRWNVLGGRQGGWGGRWTSQWGRCTFYDHLTKDIWI